MKYRIIEGELAWVMTEVNNALKKGWEPLGPPDIQIKEILDESGRGAIVLTHTVYQTIIQNPPKS